MDDTGNKGGGKATNTPPYTSFPTLKTLLKNFQEHGTPGRIDRSVLPNFSGSVAGQIIPALRFLGLIDASNHPTDMLKGLVNGYATDVWPAELKELLDEAYPALTKLNLQTASPSQFDEVFSKAYPAPDNVLRKCKAFYLAAALEAKVPISPYILRNKKPRSGAAKKRIARSNGAKTETINPGAGGKIDPPPPPSVTGQKLSEQVLTVLDMKNLSETEEAAVFTLLKFLRKEGK